MSTFFSITTILSKILDTFFILFPKKNTLHIIVVYSGVKTTDFFTEKITEAYFFIFKLIFKTLGNYLISK